MYDLVTIISGVIFVIGIISGIGPQNLNTISHAIKRNYEYQVATTCFLADSLLILIGCLGISFSAKIIIVIINIVGTIFISVYLIQKIAGLFEKHNKYTINNQILTKKEAIKKALFLTWLNPLVFMDTIVIIGSAATHYKGINLFEFTFGAVLGDAIWIYGLTLGARSFSSKLNRPIVWFILDIMTVLILSFILYKTVLFLF